MSEIEINLVDRKLLDKICEEGEYYDFCTEFMWEDIEDIINKYLQQSQQTHLNLAVEALEEIADSGHDVGYYCADLAQTALNQIKGE